jgi:hypothetical protein
MTDEIIQEQPAEEIHGEQEVYIAPGEGLPGFPSGHGPGEYLVDFEARTIRPVPIAVEETQPESEIVTESQPETEQGG